MSGLVDSSPPGESIVPYRNFTPPSDTPDKLAVSVTPGSRDQYAIGSGEQIVNLPFTSEEKANLQDVPLSVARPSTRTDIPNAVQLAGGPANPIKDAVREEWLAAGYPPPAVEGIMRRVGVESGWDVYNTGDKDKYGNPTSFSLYQHHADRAQKLAQYLENTKVDQKDPVAMARATTKFAISEMNGGDSIAAKHKAELMNPNISAQDAYGIFTSSFERPAGSPGSEETNLRSNALGPFNAGASAVLGHLMGDIDRQGKNYESAIAQGKDLRSVARAAMAKWELSSEHPPQDMRENWNQWAGAAIGLAMLGGFFGKNHTAAINAAGEMLQAANQADVRAYDIAYKRWKDHNDNGLKLIELLHGEARDVINDAKNSYDMTVTKLSTLGTMYQLQQHLDPTSVENITKELEKQRLTSEVVKIQNVDSAARDKDQKWLADHPEVKEIPAGIHNQHVGEATREASGTAGAAADAIKAQVYGNTLAAEISRWVAANPGKTESDIPPEDYATMQQRAASVSGYVRGAGAGIGATPKNIQWVDKDGKTQTGLATFDPTKKQYWPIGAPEPLPPDTKVTPGPASGNRVQPQIQRLLGAGSQMEAHLTNLGEMPIGGSIGPFMGIENKSPDELREGLLRTATRKLFSTDEIKAMQNEFVGVSRQIAALDSQGAAQGLVGLAKQAEEYAPRSDDSPVIVMRKYASLRQVVEQAMKGVVISGTANADQKAGAQEIVSKVQAAIPYTVHDINQIQFGGQKGSTEAATEIINRRRQELATTELLKHKDDPAYVESFKRHFPNVDIQGILNSGQ
jgi:hypothetical protein